jgi:DNA-binding NtrC family response regulator
MTGLAWVSPPEGGISLESFEKELILQALRKYRGNQTRAAHYLGLSRRTLGYRLEKNGIHSDRSSRQLVPVQNQRVPPIAEGG